MWGVITDKVNVGSVITEKANDFFKRGRKGVKSSSNLKVFKTSCTFELKLNEATTNKK